MQTGFFNEINRYINVYSYNKMFDLAINKHYMFNKCSNIY